MKLGARWRYVQRTSRKLGGKRRARWPLLLPRRGRPISLETRYGAQVRSARAERLVIGLTEYVDIAEWRVRGLRAKVDTGARSSALHVENLHEIGRGRVRFDVRLHRSKLDRRVSVEAPIVRRARVKASTGIATTRIFVEATVQIGPFTERIELGLVDRANMLYRMLLGRTALGSHFFVDPARRYLLTSPRRSPASHQARPPLVRRPSRH